MDAARSRLHRQLVLAIGPENPAPDTAGCVERSRRKLMTSVLGVHICHRTRPEALDALRGLLAGNRAHSVYFVHAATANLAFEDPGFRAVLNRGDLVLN